MLDVLGITEREHRAAEVESFYTESPFPGYAPGDTGPVLLDRCRRAPYLAALDAAIGPTDRVLDLGCGTGQIPNFLALAGPRRQVFGLDGCRMSLTLADGFREKAGVGNLQFVRTDLFDLPIEEGSFHVVHSRGVVHHTPDPDKAIECVARCVAPGGFLVLGFYETMGRAFHCTRRALGKMRGGEPFYALDPILRRRDFDDDKKRIWIDDQYKHPLEYILPLPHVVKVLEKLGFGWVRTLPPAVERGTLLDKTPKPSALGMFSLRLGWMLKGPIDHDAGLVCYVAQRRA
ncbi:MAG: SAM-dependent methyltransferase [Planctomycetota bacterium]|jgi:SAM-dependent methyltransferase